jgi:acyl-CoA dehydrogenase
MAGLGTQYLRTRSDPGSEAAFLDAVGVFLDQALTPDLQEAGRLTLGVHSDIAACRIWHQRLFARGWIAPSWPKAFGGTGWSTRQRFLFDRACALADAPLLFAGGLRSLGPLLIEMGTPAQKARFLPAILNGDDLWCQGFSEPGAGSDLAAISTRATVAGNAYVLNGSKIWTTGAHLANRMFAIVRTGDFARRQQGLTFLLLDMDSPGLSVKPILGLAGEHEFNQVFFDDVRVPISNRIGDQDDGWAVAKRLMTLARSNNTPAALVSRVLRRTAAAIAQAGETLEPEVRARLAHLQIRLEAFQQLELAALPAGRVGPNDPAMASVLKLVGSELHQDIAQLAMQVRGPFAAANLHGLKFTDLDVDSGARAMAKHLSVRAASIYSGTSETQRNLIAKHLIEA